MKTFLAFLLVILALISYIIVSTDFGLFQRYPILHVSLAAIGIVILVRLTWQHVTVWRLLASILSVAALGFFLWWTFVFSTYDTTDVNIHEGDHILSALTDITLKTSKGIDFNLGEEIMKQPMTLLVFYRGVW